MKIINYQGLHNAQHRRSMVSLQKETWHCLQMKLQPNKVSKKRFFHLYPFLNLTLKFPDGGTRPSTLKNPQLVPQVPHSLPSTPLTRPMVPVLLNHLLCTTPHHTARNVHVPLQIQTSGLPGLRSGLAGPGPRPPRPHKCTHRRPPLPSSPPAPAPGARPLPGLAVCD